MTLQRVVPSAQSKLPAPKMNSDFGKPRPAPKPSQTKKSKGRKPHEAGEAK